ncbi:hypothetical protein LT330_007370 [Penicillium expansum]|nr:hypothetical protein LT330_007370 [Penicillium expansum]
MSTLPFSKLLPMIPMLSSEGDFLLWSQSLKRALNSTNPRYWANRVDGPLSAFRNTERSPINRDILALIGARVDKELQSLIATAENPRLAFELLKNHFADTEPSKSQTSLTVDQPQEE